MPTSGQRDDEVPEASAANDAAVAAYRLSVQAGNPLSERRLAQMFGRTSRAGRERESPMRDKHRRSKTHLVPRSRLNRRPWRGILASEPGAKTRRLTEPPEGKRPGGARTALA
jgi:hypothetical protein